MKKIEKEFFNLEINSIKSHPIFKELNLTNDEIIYNRENIKAVLENYQLCPDEKEECMMIKDHIRLKRNADNKLILSKFKCEKEKDWQKIDDLDLNQEKKKYLKNFRFSLEKEKFHQYLKKIEKLKLPEEKIFIQKEIINLIKNLGKKEEIPNSFINISFGGEELLKIFGYKFVVWNKYTIFIDSFELKEILIQNNSYYKKSEDKLKNIERYEELKESKNIVIMEFGLEKEFLIEEYYLDLLPEFIKYRNLNCSHTYIFSVIPGAYFEKINMQKFKKKEIENIKLKKLKNMFKILD